MVHFNISHESPQPTVKNDPCQHAFVLMGTETIFGVHMTQYHCDKHRYQVIVKVTLDDDASKEYLRQREAHPDATFIFCNGEEPDEKFSIPALGAGNIDPGENKDVMKGNVFFGFRPPVSDPPPPGWFPWNLQDTIPMIADAKVTIEKILMYRPFSLQDVAPAKATYFIFGLGSEAHMTNIQTGQLLTGTADVPLYGLDVDHIMSLAEPPAWLDTDMLEAGTIVTLPAIDRRNEDCELIIHEAPPFNAYDNVDCLYRGLQPARMLKAGTTYFWSGMVCNSEQLVGTTPGMSMIITDMPRRYWR